MAERQQRSAQRAAQAGSAYYDPDGVDFLNAAMQALSTRLPSEEEQRLMEAVQAALQQKDIEMQQAKQELQQELHHKDQELQQKDRELQEKEQELQQELHQKNQELQQKDQELQEKEQELQRLRSTKEQRPGSVNGEPVAFEVAPSKQEHSLGAFVPQEEEQIPAGPSTSWLAGLFVKAFGAAIALQQGDANDMSNGVELEPTALEQLKALKESMNQFGDALGSINWKAVELEQTSCYTRAWNAMMLSIKDGVLKHKSSMAASHLHQLTLGHVDGFWGVYSSKEAQLWRPLKLLEAKKNLKLRDILDSKTTHQVENEVVQVNHLHVETTKKTGATVTELRVPFFQERLSSSCYSLDLLVPCQRNDALCKYHPGDAKQGNGIDTVFVQVPLLRFDGHPSWKDWAFPIFASQLVVMDTLCDLYLQPQLPERIIWHRPLQMLEEKGWFPRIHEMKQSARPTLVEYRYKPNGEHIVSRIMVKVFDYWLRADSGVPNEDRYETVPKGQMRETVSDELLKALQEEHSAEYGHWQTERFHRFYSVLKYPYVEGSHVPQDWKQFVKVLSIVKTANEKRYCHADLLPQNIIYHADGSSATVLDWDWARPVPETKAGDTADAPCYPRGWNYEDLKKYRHEKSQAGEPLALVHDSWAAAQMAKLWFKDSAKLNELVAALKKSAAGVTAELVEIATGLSCELQDSQTAKMQNTGSPNRA